MAMSSATKTARKWIEKRLIAQRSGFTLVEVVVASFLLTTGLAATMNVLNSANHANNVAQRQQTAAGIAQRALEEIADLDYDQLSLTSAPPGSSDPNIPLNRVNGSQFETEEGQDETLVVGEPNAAVNPGPDAVNEGGVNAEVYRFVTWVDAPNYQGCTQNCDSNQDYKRITVAVRASSEAFRGFDKYVLVSTLRIDPLLGPNGQVTQPPDPNPTESHDNFYLYDTRNSDCATGTYQQPSGSHATHDTRGYCDSPAGDYPDLMGTALPPNPSEPDLPPLYTYSTDLTGDYTGGLAMQRGTDCTLDSLDEQQIHSWTTKPFTTAYELSGKMSFDFWSATVGGTSGAGKVCVWLYDRVIVEGSPQDTPIGSHIYTLSSWPGELTNLSFTFSHDPYTVPVGHRLRFVLTVSSASASDLQFIYDYPASPSFVQLRTTTPITQ